MATDIIARGMITEYKSGTNISFKENDDGSVTISASGDVSSEDTVARETIDNHKLNKNNPHNVTAEQIGLNNVDNTADLDKPISTAVKTALDKKANIEHTHKKSDITDFPTSLPANGGNADTVNNYGISDEINSGVITVPPTYYTDVARVNSTSKMIESWDTKTLKVGYANKSTDADTVDGKHASDFATLDNISAVAIKSTAISGTTDNNGNIKFAAASANKVPLMAAISSRYCIPLVSADGSFYIHAMTGSGAVANTAVSGTVYYVEM